MSDSPVPVTLKWGKQVYQGLSLCPGSSANAFKEKIQALTGVPVERQKVMCKGAWNGALKDGVLIDASLKLSPGQSELAVMLIGTADTAPAPPMEQVRFMEDLSPQEVAATAAAAAAEALAKAEGMIVALQKPPGERDDSSKKESYNYGGCVTGLPQYQIEDALRRRRSTGKGATMLLGQCAMTCGLELGRAYVNAVIVLLDGTLVSGRDDGHIQLWRHGMRVRDVIHEMPLVLLQAGARDPNDGITCLTCFAPSLHDSIAFASGGHSCVKLWTIDGNCVQTLMAPMGASPIALASVKLGSSNRDYLSAIFRRSHEPDPNMFRLVPQNEEERRRRAQAEAEEAAFRERLFHVVRSVFCWYRIKDVDPEGGDADWRLEVLEPPDGSQLAPLVAITTLISVIDDKRETCMVCGDTSGGIRVWRNVCGSEGELRWATGAILQLCPQDNSGSSVRRSIASVVCMAPLAENASCGQLLAISTENSRNLTESSQLMPGAIALHVPLARAVFLLNMSEHVVHAVLNAQQDIVHCLCALPQGGLLTGGGKHDATVRFWESSQWCCPRTDLDHADVDEECNDADITTALPFFLSEAPRLKEPGYVFAMTVLPDVKPGSQLFALAAARYNVVQICL